MQTAITQANTLGPNKYRFMQIITLLLVASLFHETLAACGTVTRVITDNDDTVAGGGRIQRGFGKLSGIDKSWTYNLDNGQIIYPGIGHFQVELARGPTNAAPQDIIVCSARPDEVCPPFCIGQDDTVAQAMVQGGGRMDDTVLYGEWDDFFNDDDERNTEYAESKFDAISEYMTAHPNQYKYFLVGDSATGDVLLSKMMRQDASSKIKMHTQQQKCVVAAFIYDVVNSPSHDSVHPLPVNLAGVTNIFFYSSPAKAAQIAHQQGYISKQGLKRVIDGIKATPQWASCFTKCKCTSGFMCKFGVCSCPANGCQADSSGYPPGCKHLVPDVNAATSYYNTLSNKAEVQAVDEEAMQSTIVSSGAGRPVNQKILVGAVTGMAMFALFATVAVILVVRRRRAENYAMVDMPSPASSV